MHALLLKQALTVAETKRKRDKKGLLCQPGSSIIYSYCRPLSRAHTPCTSSTPSLLKHSPIRSTQACIVRRSILRTRPSTRLAVFFPQLRLLSKTRGRACWAELTGVRCVLHSPHRASFPSFQHSVQNEPNTAQEALRVASCLVTYHLGLSLVRYV